MDVEVAVAPTIAKPEMVVVPVEEMEKGEKFPVVVAKVKGEVVAM